jgi:phosphomannomutase/phosphomannomutase/phosphoglucomutase
MSTDNRLKSFKAYDIRGEVPTELNEEMAYDIGRAYVAEVQPQGAVAVGRDVRETSEAFSKALMRGLNDAGVDAVDIGLCGTEMVYYASSLDGMGGGAMVTASHNPRGYNGIKLVREGGKPISGETGLMDMEKRVRTGDIPGKSAQQGSTSTRDIMDIYIEQILSFVNIDALKPLKVLANPGNGCAGPVMEKLEKHLPFDFEHLFYDPDGTFPNGIPNPLLEENRSVTSNALTKHNADFGVAWDGDFDRCFLFDENGDFIEGYYLVGFLSKRILKTERGSKKIVHDPRLVWNTVEIVNEEGGSPVMSKSGHSFMKEKMRDTEAVYGGEMSAHHYFRDFSYSDSGMIPWLLVAEEMSITGKKLSELVAERIALYPCSGEINRRVPDPDEIIERVRKTYEPRANNIVDIDGISLQFDEGWRFNLRKSNTEPLVRLNVETKGDTALLEEKTDEILELIEKG